MRANSLKVHMIRQSPGSVVWHYARESYTNNDTKLIHYGDCGSVFFSVSDCRDFFLGATLPEPICKACLQRRGYGRRLPDGHDRRG